MIKCTDFSLSDWDEYLLNTRIRCVYMHLAQMKDKWECETHDHEYLELGYILKGTGQYCIGKETYTACAGDLYVIPKGAPHNEVYDSNTSFEVVFLMVEFIGENADWLEEKLNNLQGKIVLGTEPSIKFLYDEIVDEVVFRRDGYLSAVEANLKRLVLLVFRSMCDVTPVETRLQNHNRVMADTVKKYIADTLAEDEGYKLNIAHIAKKFYYHPKYLAGVFKKEEGISLSQYIMQSKVSCARLLLQDTDKSINNIWVVLGFSNAQHFYRVFKKYTNSTPGNYRAKYQPLSELDDFLHV